MRQSQLFGKTLREDPKDEVSKNAILLERGGFIYKTMAGVYDFLPLGLRVLSKINGIIREEMNGIGGQEVFLSAFQPKERWDRTGRWDSAGDVMYQLKDSAGHPVGLGFTHEEAVAEIATRTIFSYKDLPLAIYQIQTKFRNEPRAKSGLIRDREFLMKDLYSFHTNEADLERFYGMAKLAYERIFKRVGLLAYVTEASGGSFTKQFSHEFQVVSDAGEDWILHCTACRFAQNKEISKLSEGDRCPSCGSAIRLSRSIEVGNIFKLGTKFSEAFGLSYLDADAKKIPVLMGSYGIGPGRLMGAVVEVLHDERGIIWPEGIAPFRAHLIALESKDRTDTMRIRQSADRAYAELQKKGVDVLYDDRSDKSAGQKFADADLLGIPLRLVISEKTIAKKSVEMKKRSLQAVKLIPLVKLAEAINKR